MANKGLKLKRWSENEISKLIAVVKDAGTDSEGFRKATITLPNRTVRSCSQQYYKRNLSIPSKFKSLSTKPTELIRLPGSSSSLPITIRSGRATILVVDGKITITT